MQNGKHAGLSGKNRNLMFLLFQNALHTNFTHHFLKGIQTKPNNTLKDLENKLQAI